jgi:hypothetical protein
MGYRATCYELYQKSASADSQPTVKALADRGRSPGDQRRSQAIFKAIAEGTEKDRQEADRRKQRMDQHLLAKDYSAWARCLIEFDGDLSIVSNGHYQPKCLISKGISFKCCMIVTRKYSGCTSERSQLRRGAVVFSGLSLGGDRHG